MVDYLRINASLRRDPTRTTGIRAAFVRDARRRFNAVKEDIRSSVLEKDCFGILPGVFAVAQSSALKQFAFARTPEKIAQFMKWLEEQEKKNILQIISRPGMTAGTEAAWSSIYIDSAYQQGIRRARQEMKRAGYSVPATESVVGGVGALMNRPFHADRVGLIYTRTFEDLKTVASVMNSRIRHALTEGLTKELAQGMAEGRNPIQIARNILSNVDYAVNHVGKVRAEMIARTEVIRAHTEATIAEYRDAAGEIGVEVQAEVSTAADPCPDCEALALGGPYSLNEAETLIPYHPNCRCALIPVMAEERRQRAA